MVDTPCGQSNEGTNMVGGGMVPRSEDAQAQDPEPLRAELAPLLERVVVLELEVATTEGALTAFESVYLLRCGRLYADLDELDAELARFLAELRPADPVLVERARSAERKAETSREAADRGAEQGELPEFKPNEELKSLYRITARDVHPDRAVNDADAADRHDWMVQLGALYRRGDVAGIRTLGEVFSRSRTAWTDLGVSAEVAILLRQIAMARRTITRLEARLAELRAGELHDLWSRANAATERGEDFLGSIAHGLRKRVAATQERLKALRRRKGP